MKGSHSRSTGVSAEEDSRDGIGGASGADGGEAVRLEEVGSTFVSGRDEVVAGRGDERVATESSGLRGGEGGEGEEACNDGCGEHLGGGLEIGRAHV